MRSGCPYRSSKGLRPKDLHGVALMCMRTKGSYNNPRRPELQGRFGEMILDYSIGSPLSEDWGR